MPDFNALQRSDAGTLSRIGMEFHRDSKVLARSLEQQLKGGSHVDGSGLDLTSVEKCKSAIEMFFVREK